MIHKKIMQEIQDIPEDKLAEIYDIIHYFRLGLNLEAATERLPGFLKDTLGEFLTRYLKMNLRHGNKLFH